MISPRTRLLFAVAVFALPTMTMADLVPTLRPWCVLGLFAFVIIVLGDALFSLDRLGALVVQLPELVRFSKNRAGPIAVAFTNKGAHDLKIRSVPDLPKEFLPREDEIQLEIAASHRVTPPFVCTAEHRGRFRLERIFVETASRLGLWSIRRTMKTACELRVYPDLLSERRNIAAVFLHRGEPGSRPVRRVGKGRDFEQLRDYIAGDSADEIHWKATAKRGRPVTKIFQVERTQEVYVVLDASRLSARSMGGLPVLERFINSALILCLAAGQRSDLFGLTTFADKVRSFVRAKNGKAHYNLCRDTLYRLQPASVTPDFDDLFTFLRTRLRRRALLVFLTALDDPALAAAFTDKIELLARQHLVLVNMPRPPHAQPLFDGSKVEDVSQIYRRLGGHLVWHDLRELAKRLQHRGVKLSLLDHQKMTSEIVAQYLQIKQRQLI